FQAEDGIRDFHVTGVQTCALPIFPGCFSPFPHGTTPLSVTRKYLALGGGPPCFPQDSPCPMVLWISTSYRRLFTYRTLTFSGLTFQPIQLRVLYYFMSVLNPVHYCRQFRLFPVRSPLLRKSIFLSLPPVTKMFQFSGFPSSDLFYSAWDTYLIGGFPHSDICGSMSACDSPQLFVAGHVLLRLLVPRHPPCALRSLIFSHSEIIV